MKITAASDTGYPLTGSTFRQSARAQAEGSGYDQLRLVLSKSIADFAEHADVGGIDKARNEFRDIKRAVRRLRARGARNLNVAIAFWDSWIAEVELGFPSNVIMSKSLWRPLAEAVAAALLADKEIVDPRILGIAELSSSVSLARTQRRPSL